MKVYFSEEFWKSIASMLFNDNLNHDFKYWPSYALKSMCTTFYIDLSYFRNLYVGGLVVSQLRLILHMFCHYAIMKLAQKTMVNLINLLHHYPVKVSFVHCEYSPEKRQAFRSLQVHKFLIAFSIFVFKIWF